MLQIYFVFTVNGPVQVKIELTTSSEKLSPRTNKLFDTILFETKQEIAQTRNATNCSDERCENFLT